MSWIYLFSSKLFHYSVGFIKINATKGPPSDSAELLHRMPFVMQLNLGFGMVENWEPSGGREETYTLTSQGLMKYLSTTLSSYSLLWCSDVHCYLQKLQHFHHWYDNYMWFITGSLHAYVTCWQCHISA